MSFDATRAVWAHARTDDPQELLVLLALADYVNHERQSAWPSKAALIAKTRLSESTVKRVLRSLAAAGAIAVETNAGPRGVNVYRLTLDGPRGGGGVCETPQGGSGGPPEPGSEPGSTTETLRVSAARSTVAETPPPTAQVILGAYIDRCASRPPGRVVGQLARLIKEMVDEQVPPRAIWNGLLAWGAKGSPPTALPGFVNAALNQVAMQAFTPLGREMSTGERRAAEAIAAGRRVQARLDAEAGRA